MNSHYSQLQLSARALVWGTIGACCAGVVACSGSETLEPESDTAAQSDLTAFEETHGDSNVSASELSADGATDDPGLEEDDSRLGTDEPETGALEQALTGSLEGTIEMGWELRDSKSIRAGRGLDRATYSTFHAAVRGVPEPCWSHAGQ